MTAQNDKKLDDLIKLQTETLATFQKLLTKSTAPSNTNTGSNRPSRKCQCPHCKHHHPNIPIDKCWELPTNAANYPAHWQSLAECNAQYST
jgi:hypothetical protein